MFFKECVYGKNIWCKLGDSVSVGDKRIPGKTADVFWSNEDTKLVIMDRDVELFVIYTIGAGIYATAQGKFGGPVEHIENYILVGDNEIDIKNIVFIGIVE